MANPDSKGGMAIGVSGRVPQGNEVHSIILKGSVMYNSENGLIGDAVDVHTAPVKKEVRFGEGNRVGIKHDPSDHTLSWYFDRELIGISPLTPAFFENNRTLYPVFGLYVPEQKLKVDFH